MNISLIVAIGPGGAIGKDGKIPWFFPEDLEHFKRTTLGHVVIMGRRTWESLPWNRRPLPNRTNVVVSSVFHDMIEPPSGVVVATSIDYGVRLAARLGVDACIIGGAGIYREAIEDKLVDVIHLTEVATAPPDCDTFFLLDRTGFVEVERRQGQTPQLQFVKLVRA